MNPCRGKGDPRNRQFTVGSGSYRVAPCECAKVRISIDPEEDGRYIRFGLSTDPETPGAIVRLRSPRLLPEQTVRAVPCYEVFRHLFSHGTRAYRKLPNSGSTFLGCQRLENSLIEEQLVRLIPAEREELGWHLLEGTDREPLFCLPSPDDFVEWYADMAAYAIELAIDPKKKEIAAQISMSDHPSYSPAISDLIRLPPVDLHHAQIRRLLSSGTFENNLRLKVAAFLLSRNIKNKSVIQHIFPHYDFEEFKKAKREIDRIVAKTLPEKLKRLRRVWKSLTVKQKSALKLRYDEELSHEEGAGRLQISVDSFRDRLTLAERKLERAFPELTRPKESTVDPKKEITPVIHYNNQSDKVALVEIEDRKVTPWGPPKMRMNINKPEMYRWLDRVCPLI